MRRLPFPAFRPAAGRVRAATFLAVNVLLLACVFIGFVRPVYEAFAEREDRIVELSETARRYRAFLDRVPASESVQTLRVPQLFEAASDGALDAGLQTILKKRVEAAGGRLSSTRSIPPKMEANVRYAGVHLDFSGTIRAVQTTLQAVETNVPYLFIETAVLSSSAAPASAEPDVQVQMDVYAPIDRSDPR